MPDAHLTAQYAMFYLTTHNSWALPADWLATWLSASSRRSIVSSLRAGPISRQREGRRALLIKWRRRSQKARAGLTPLQDITLCHNEMHGRLLWSQQGVRLRGGRNKNYEQNHSCRNPLEDVNFHNSEEDGPMILEGRPIRIGDGWRCQVLPLLCCLAALSVAEVTYRRWQMNELVYSIAGMMLTGENWSTGRKFTALILCSTQIPSKVVWNQLSWY
jgi:hypothetical protein